MKAKAALSQCQHCRIPTIDALCEGLEVSCELVPLTRSGELQAAIAGRQTYRLDADRRLWRNDPNRISDDAPLPGDHRLVAHDCDTGVPAAWAAPAPTPARRPDPHEEPQW